MPGTIFRHLLVWGRAFFCGLLFCSASLHADSGTLEIGKTIYFHIGRQSLEHSLLVFSKQSKIQIISQTREVLGRSAPAVLGRYAPLEALKQLLKPTGIGFAIIDRDTVVIARDLSGYSDAGYSIFTPGADDAESDGGEAKEDGLSPARPTDDEIFLEDVVVTAQKRPQLQQDVPAHFQVIPDIVLRDTHLSRIEDLSFILPTVTFTQRRGYDQSSFRIRGMGTQVLGAGVEPSVATMIDGVVMARGGAMLNELQDIERIEILNGPQGTLFGKNASAGLLNVITHLPNHQHHEAYIDARMTSDREYGVRLGLSAPITNQLAYRTSAFISYWDGNAQNVVTGNRVNGNTAYGFRSKMSLLTDSGADFLVSVDYSKQNSECCARITRKDVLGLVIDPSFVGDATPPGSIANIIGIPITDYSDQIAHNRDPRQDSTNYGASLEISLPLGNHSLKAITAARAWKSRNGWDNDLMPIDFHRRQRSNRDADWFTQEIRLTSPEYDSYDYLLGFYYFNSDTKALEWTERTLVDVPVDQHIFVSSSIRQENAAVFAHLNVRPSNRCYMIKFLPMPCVAAGTTTCRASCCLITPHQQFPMQQAILPSLGGPGSSLTCQKMLMFMSPMGEAIKGAALVWNLALIRSISLPMSQWQPKRQTVLKPG